MQSVSSWLNALGLEQYAQVFTDNDVDLDVLRILGEKDLQDLGVSFGHRKKLLKAIADLNGAEARAPEPDSVAPATAGERRQLTVLFCDMVGFTELASRVDPEILQRIIRSYEDTCAGCITRYEGYVFQRLGDGIVAFFGYPLAHEGESERAIRAGLEIIESLARLDIQDAGNLQVRIGVATGLVVVAAGEKGAVGETMNLAARLQAFASPGSIVVSERVHRLAGGAFDYEDLGEQTLKGIARPTHAYRILGVSTAASRFDAATSGILTPLVGREQEIGLFMERWALAQDGEGQVVLLSGEPGIGKSRILSALRGRLEGHGAQTLRFQCSPYYVNSAFWPSIDNFERVLKFGRDESPESKLDKLEALIVTHFGRPLADVRFIALILSIPCEERYGTLPIAPQKHKDETRRTLVDLTEAAARKQPSVMLFEDLHWADPTTLEVLDLLIDRVRTIPLLVVLTHRPEFQSRWSEYGHVTALNLAKLTRAQSAAMVSRLAGDKALPADLLEQILIRTDGVPLFVEELTKSILESGEVKDTGDRYEYVGVTHNITIPATLRDSLMARLDRAMPVKEIAQIGAAIGREFSYELISAVASMTSIQLDAALDQLTVSGLAFRRGTPPEATYTFKHALVQDAAYDSMLRTHRQQLHAQIVKVLEQEFADIAANEPELLAHHFTQAELNERAVPCWIVAGQRALSRMALPEAIGHLKMALALIVRLSPSTERDFQELDLRLMLSTAYLAHAGWHATEILHTLAPARDVVARMGTTDKLLPILFHTRNYHVMRGDFTPAFAVVEEIRALGKSSSDSSALLLGNWLEAEMRCWRGDFSEARRLGNAAIALYDPKKHAQLVHVYNHDPYCSTLVWAGLWLWALGFPDQARETAEEELRVARQIGHTWNLIWVLASGNFALTLRGDVTRAKVRLDEALAVAKAHGLNVLYATARWHHGVVCIANDEHEQGYAEVTDGSKVMQDSGVSITSPFAFAERARAMLGLGRLNEAKTLIDEALKLTDRVGDRIWEAESHRIDGLIALAGPQSDADAAEIAFSKSLDISRAQQAKGWELRTATSYARLLQARGRAPAAKELLQPIYDWFTEGFDSRDLIEAKKLLGELR